jgi:hypothetical protein
VDVLREHELCGLLSKIKRYATSRMVADSRPDAVNEIFSIYLILAAALCPGVYSIPNRNEYRKQKNNVPGE